MMQKSRMHAYLPAKDVARARRFYDPSRLTPLAQAPAIARAATP
jgi:hypothetical protein